MSRRQRVLAVVVVAVLAVAAATGYLWRAHTQEARREATPGGGASLAQVRAAPHIVFRSSARDSTYGRLAMVPLDDPGGTRAVTGTSCERAYATRERVLCLAQQRGLAISYRAEVLDDEMRLVRPLQLAGVASRARLSRDGTLAATTSFVSGHSYASTSFSTQTLVTRVDGPSFGDLERFTLVHRGSVVTPRDRNVWGVTFADDDDTFYVTVAWSGRTWLARGSLTQRRLTTLRDDAECPSLSPDGTHVAYKKRLDLPAGQWRLATLDLASGRETLLADDRSVDDQLEWLDDRTVVYGLLRTDQRSAVTDVWAVPADGSGRPQVLVTGAWSPAVVR